MRRIGASTLGALLVGCAGGTDGIPPVSLDWDRSPYVASAAERSVGAVVALSGQAVPSDATIEVRAIQGGVVVEAASKRIDRDGRLAVTLRPEADASGAYVVTATAVIDGVLHSATTMLVVAD